MADGRPGRDLRRGADRLAAGQNDEAARHLERALKRAPDDPEALHLLGVARLNQGRAADGLDLLIRCVRAVPTHVPALLALAVTLRQAGENEPAAECLRQVVRVEPGHETALFNLGNIELALGRTQAAIACYRRSLEIRPDQPAVLTNLGVALALADDGAGAVDSYERALVLAPGSLDTRRNLGLLLLGVGRPADAADHLAAVLAARPDETALLKPLAIAQEQAGRPAEAEASFRRLARLDPADPLHAYNLGVALAAQDRPDEAAAAFRRALTLDPALAPAEANLGYCLRELGDTGGALARFDRAAALDPADDTVAWNRALALAALGRLTEAWPGFERRERLPAYRRLHRATTLPRWRGEPIMGKRLLIEAEQGFGDTLQMVRFVAGLRAAGIDMVLRVQPALVGLLRAQPALGPVIAQHEPAPDCDLACPAMSLPACLGVTLDTIPAASYLDADPDAVAAWRARLPAGPRIGFAWAGNPGHQGDRHRSVPLDRFLYLSARLPATWVSLQRELRPGDEALLGGRSDILALGGGLADFAATAALIASLDAVVTVDTAIAHLAGALGRPVTILLPFYADWRWLLGRADSPWYPSARLIRQDRRGDWDGVFERLVTPIR